MGLGDYAVCLDKPLGLILEERDDDNDAEGLYVKDERTRRRQTSMYTKYCFIIVCSREEKSFVLYVARL